MIDVNARYTELVGFKREELIGHTVYEMGLWADRNEGERVLDRLRHDGALRVCDNAADGCQIGLREAGAHGQGDYAESRCKDSNPGHSPAHSSPLAASIPPAIVSLR